MMVSTILVILMVVPGLALFYGGLVRSKNMLSVLMQVLVVFSLISVLWAVYGYSLAFGGSGLIIANLDKLFLSGVTSASLADTFTEGVKIPEFIFIAFQATFAGITCALIVGSFAERIRFGAVLMFSVLWFTFSYLPMAHMVWFCASLLWVGWFGFNAGSNLESNGGATLAFVNTLFATAAAVLAWSGGEALSKGKASMLGAASGAVAGLVAITPACGSVGPMGAIIIARIGKGLMIDHAHSIVIGETAVVGDNVSMLHSVTLGGTGKEGFSIASQLLIQAEGVLITMVWSSVVAFVAYKIVDMAIGLRVSEEDEREGLDIRSHGETAYSR